MVFLDIVYAAIFPLFLVRVLRDPSYRSHLAERFGSLSFPRRGGRRRIWVHGASVGELNACRKMVETLSRDPGVEVVVSTNTPAGRKFHADAFPGMICFYRPLDFSWAVRRTFDRLKPDLLVLVEQELWTNLLRAAARARVPVVVVNGRMTERTSVRYRRFGGLLRAALRDVRRFAMQSDAAMKRLRSLGVNPARVSVTGNMKFDLPSAGGNTESFRTLFGLEEEGMVLAAGSTHAPEESVLLAAFRSLRGRFPSLKLILAPRHLNRLDEVEKMVAQSGFAWYKRSSIGSGTEWDILILDTMGELPAVYGVADVVFVGGTIAQRGGQNIIEPASLEKPIVVGRSLHNFAEIADELRDAGGLTVVNDGGELAAACESLLADPARRSRLGGANRTIVGRHAGATAGNVALVRELLNDKGGHP